MHCRRGRDTTCRSERRLLLVASAKNALFESVAGEFAGFERARLSWVTPKARREEDSWTERRRQRCREPFFCSRSRRVGLGLDVLPFFPNPEPFYPVGHVDPVQ